MKLTKTQWIIVAVVAGVAIWYFFLRKKDEGTKKESGYTNFDLDGGQLEAGYYGIMGFSGKETGYMSEEVGPGIESGYSLFQLCRDGKKWDAASKRCVDAEAGYVVPTATSSKGGSLGNAGQLCKKDRQCAPGLLCINGRCSTPPRSIPRPIAPIKTDLFPVFSPTTTTLSSTPRGVTDTAGSTSTGTGVVSPTTSTGSVPRTLSGATGMTVEAGYMM